MVATLLKVAISAVWMIVFPEYPNDRYNMKTSIRSATECLHQVLLDLSSNEHR